MGIHVGDGRHLIVPDRRSLFVLIGLATAMTFSSVLLLVLEPGPITPLTTSINLRAQSPGETESPDLFDTSDATRPWSAIMIYETGTLAATAQTIARDHEQRGLGGLGYHFVVESDADRDGEMIRAGFRWREQLAGAHASGRFREVSNQHAIGICLVADCARTEPSRAQMKVLVELIRQLQKRFDIPSHRVRLDLGDHSDRHFPVGWMRTQLLMPIS
ncbi:MAG: hypothetical protein CMJ18_12475 [Phycisphaeraceae bacterium]|nr:hypothetical protein [Phycisphaeraceae bacterium]